MYKTPKFDGPQLLCQMVKVHFYFFTEKVLLLEWHHKIMEVFPWIFRIYRSIFNSRLYSNYNICNCLQDIQTKRKMNVTSWSGTCDWFHFTHNRMKSNVDLLLASNIHVGHSHLQTGPKNRGWATPPPWNLKNGWKPSQEEMLHMPLPEARENFNCRFWWNKIRGGIK